MRRRIRVLGRRGTGAGTTPGAAQASTDPGGDGSPRTRNSPLSSLSVRNYRIYFWGQAVSVAGTWMQNVALSWFVLDQTKSSTLLGAVVGVRYGPMLLFSLWGGVLTDRYNRRKLLLITQIASGVISGLMAVLIALDLAGIVPVLLFAFGLGALNVIASPARQTFVNEMVPRGLLLNAISLSSITANVARVIGPTLAAWTIATLGTAACFALNALSFGAVVLSLLLMDTTKLAKFPPVARASGQLRDGIRYACTTPGIGWPLLMISVIGMMAWEFQVSLPLVATDVLHGTATTYGLMFSALGAGAVVGGFRVATHARVTSWMLVRSSLLLGVTICIAAVMSTLVLELLALAAVGYTVIAFNSMAKTALQLNSAPDMRGRVMSFWSMGWQGSGTIGGPLIGWIGEVAGARWSLAAGGLSTVAIAIAVLAPIRRIRINGFDDESTEPSDVNLEGFAATRQVLVDADVANDGKETVR